METRIKDKIRRYGFILIGQFIASLAFASVLIPNNLVAVGLGGIATIVNNLTGLKIQVLLILLSLPIIVWALVMYKRKQVYFAVLCYGLFTFFIGVVETKLPTFETDPWVAAVTGGILLGIAGGMVISQGVANGPEAIVGLWLQENKEITIGTFFLIVNTVIICSSIVYGELTLIVYSLMSNFIAGKVTDFIIIGNKQYYIVNIMSDNYLEITNYIHLDLARGVTFIQSMDASNVKKKIMLKTVVTKRELVKLRYYVKNLKDDSFVYATRSSGILGGGFEV